MVKQSSARISTRRKVLAWGIMIVLFILAVGITAVSYAYPQDNGIIGLFVRFHFEAMLGIAMAGVIIGASSFYLFSNELEEKDKSLELNTQLLLSFLNEGERECVQFLIDHHGQAYQSELSKLSGMTRLKAHRLVSRLKERKIVHVHEYGKVNLVVLNPGLRPPGENVRLPEPGSLTTPMQE